MNNKKSYFLSLTDYILIIDIMYRLYREMTRIISTSQSFFAPYSIHKTL